MTDHNINEAAPLALGALAAKGGKLAAASKVAGGVGKVAGRAKGLLDAGSSSVDKTSGRVSEEKLNEFVAPALKGAAKVLPKVVPFVRNAAKAKAASGTAAAGAATKGGKTDKGPDVTSPDYLFKSFKPKPKPLPKPVKIPGPDTEPQKQPNTEPQPEKDPQKDSNKKTTQAPAKVGSPSKTGSKTGTGTKTKSGQKTQTQTNNKTAAAAATATGLGAAALNMMKPKSPKTGGPIGKTSGRVNVKPKQTEEELEVVCDFLLDKGYASTGVEAENIFEHMSDEWKEFILNS